MNLCYSSMPLNFDHIISVGLKLIKLKNANNLL